MNESYILQKGPISINQSEHSDASYQRESR